MGNQIPKLKLTYLNVEGAGEKIRLALALQGIPFEDNRISFEHWGEIKPTTKFGQVPFLEIDGKTKTTIYQSNAILRFVARLKSKTLYPMDPVKEFKVEEVLGLCDDFDRAFMPAFYMGMCPEWFGHPEGFSQTDDGKALLAKLRTEFIKNELPRYMGYFGSYLSDTKFLCGDEITIADLRFFPTINYFQKGSIDCIPVDCLDPYPKIVEWIKRIYALPKIAAWYAAKEALKEAPTTEVNKEAPKEAPKEVPEDEDKAPKEAPKEVPKGEDMM